MMEEIAAAAKPKTAPEDNGVSDGSGGDKDKAKPVAASDDRGHWGNEDDEEELNF